LTLTERSTRFEITRRIADRSAESFRKELDVLGRQLVPRLFRKLFKTVAGDNRGAFSDIEGMSGRHYRGNNG